MDLHSDTSPATEKVLVDLLRRATISRKLEMMSQLNAMAKSLVLSNLRQQYPNAKESELRRRLADRVLGSELATTVYGSLTAVAKTPETTRAGAHHDE